VTMGAVSRTDGSVRIGRRARSARRAAARALLAPFPAAVRQSLVSQPVPWRE